MLILQIRTLVKSMRSSLSMNGVPWRVQVPAQIEFGPKTWAQVVSGPPQRRATPKPAAPGKAVSTPPLPHFSRGAHGQAPLPAAASTPAHSTPGQFSAQPRSRGVQPVVESASGLEGASASLEQSQDLERYPGNAACSFPASRLFSCRSCAQKVHHARGNDDAAEGAEANTPLRNKPGHSASSDRRAGVDASSCNGLMPQAHWGVTRRAQSGCKPQEGEGVPARDRSPAEPSQLGSGRGNPQAKPIGREPLAGQNAGNRETFSGRRGPPPPLSARSDGVVQLPPGQPKPPPQGSDPPPLGSFASREEHWAMLRERQARNEAAARQELEWDRIRGYPLPELSSGVTASSVPTSATGTSDAQAGLRTPLATASQAPAIEKGVTPAHGLKLQDAGDSSMSGTCAGCYDLTAQAERAEGEKQPAAAPWADLPSELLHAVLVAGGYGVQLALAMAQTCRDWRQAVSTHEQCLSELVFPIPEVCTSLLHRFYKEDYAVHVLHQKGLERCRVIRLSVPYIVHMAAMNNNVDACISTARILMNAHDEEGALRYYERAADLKVPEGQVHLANAYYLGCLGKLTNLEEALSLFSQAATSIMNSNGLGLPSKPMARYWNRTSRLNNLLLGRSAIVLAYNRRDGQTGVLGGSDEELHNGIHWLKVAACTTPGKTSWDAGSALTRWERSGGLG